MDQTGYSHKNKKHSWHFKQRDFNEGTCLQMCWKRWEANHETGTTWSWATTRSTSTPLKGKRKEVMWQSPNGGSSGGAAPVARAVWKVLNWEVREKMYDECCHREDAPAAVGPAPTPEADKGKRNTLASPFPSSHTPVLHYLPLVEPSWMYWSH